MHELHVEGWIAGSNSASFVQMINSGLLPNVDALGLLQKNWENCVRLLCIIQRKRASRKRMQREV